jgi:hypothetical protein
MFFISMHSPWDIKKYYKEGNENFTNWPNNNNLPNSKIVSKPMNFAWIYLFSSKLIYMQVEMLMVFMGVPIGHNFLLPLLSTFP